MSNLNEFLLEQKKDKKFKMAYAVVEQKYELIRELIAFRKKMNMTQKEFAELMGVKQQAISRYEKGAIDPRLSFILKMLYITGRKIRIRNAGYKAISDKIITVENKPLNCTPETMEYKSELCEVG
jgi:transcriptional regulator with XRE-family HTH domain